jgi:hypothetical protein
MMQHKLLPGQERDGLHKQRLEALKGISIRRYALIAILIVSHIIQSSALVLPYAGDLQRYSSN